jgi:hypothetical protein
MSKHNGADSAFGVAAGSGPMTCATCENWQSIGGIVEHGHCHCFDKITAWNHGTRCTAWSARDEVLCANCDKPAIKKTEDGIPLCAACYDLCPEDPEHPN